MTQSRLETILHHVETLKTISKQLEISIKKDLEIIRESAESMMLSSTCLKELYDDPFGADLAEDFMALFEAIRSVSLFYRVSITGI